MNNKIKDILFYIILFVIDFIFLSFIVCKIDRCLYYSKSAVIIAFVMATISVGVVAILDKKCKFFS